VLKDLSSNIEMGFLKQYKEVYFDATFHLSISSLLVPGLSNKENGKCGKALLEIKLCNRLDILAVEMIINFLTLLFHWPRR
jgi:hypothetical protein